MKFICYAHEKSLGKGSGVRSTTQGIAMLVDHITDHHATFGSWLSESLRRCHQFLPASDVEVEKQPPVPRELFDPSFDPREDAVREALTRFVATLDPTRNPYLRSAEAMLADGFVGQPYPR
jgi:hypothetical protein